MSMKPLILGFFTFFLLLQGVVSEEDRASLPPRGWNSFDSFSWIITEHEFFQNAEVMKQRLKSLGYEYLVVDYQWYRKMLPGDNSATVGTDLLDEWGRVIPDPSRWPSSNGGKGFTDVTRRVHEMGLKFGIHVMRGISTQALNANTPILDITTGRAYEESGRKWFAKDIALPEKACTWMPNEFMSVNTSLGAGRAFLSSLYHQYADWGIDFVKHDCVFGNDFSLDEITIVSEVIRGLNHPIIYSLSPGFGVTPTMAKSVVGLTNMYRITGDDWDKWDDVALHFDISRDLSNANMTGARGLLGKSWPDFDMLPLGWLSSPGVSEGPHRKTNLTLDEQKTQMTLWSMAKSPLMFGGDMTKLDDATFNIIANLVLLEINSFSSNNKEFPYVTSTKVNRPLEKTEDMNIHLEGDVCMNPEMKGWIKTAYKDDTEQICWNGSASMNNKSPYCLYTKKPSSPVDQEVHKQQYEGKIQLLLNTTLGICLETTRQFYPCQTAPNQIWEFSNDGTLKNEYSGLCVSVKANVEAKRVRSWIATGRKGEVYVAFFNLESEKTVISAKLEDLSKLFGVKLGDGSYNYRELWSGKDLGQLKDQISADVESHGCALFVLNSNN